MQEKMKQIDTPERKLEIAKFRKSTILTMEARIRELKKAICETDNDLAKKLFVQELDLMERRREQLLSNSSGKPKDLFQPLTDYSPK